MTDYPQPPASGEAERALIGAILNGADMDEVSAALEPADFFQSDHQRIYQQCLNMHNQGHTLDVVTVSEWMDDAGELKKVGGLARLGEMAQDTPVVAQAPAYAKIVREHALRRALILLANRAQGIAYNPDGRTAAQMVGEVEEALSALQIARGSSEARLIRDLIPDAMEEVERRHQARGRDELVGLSTGYADLDNMIGGLEGGDLIIVAGRPSHGKCLGIGTPVLMYDGTIKLVEDVKVGDQVMGDDSRPRNVRSLVRGYGQMYRVSQNKGIDYRVNEHHILSVMKSRDDTMCEPRKTITDIPVSDYLKKSAKWKNDHKGFKVGIDLPEKELPLDPYFLGLWLGDGSSTKPCIFSIEKEIVEYLEGFAASRGEKVIVGEQRRECKQYSIGNGRSYSYKYPERTIHHQLKRLNLFNNKHIPEEYLLNSRENRLQLLAGLIDTDGHLCAAYGAYEIIQKSETLAKQIKFLADSLGYRSYIGEKKGTIKELGFEGLYYRVIFNGDVSEIPVRVKRKKSKPWTDWRCWKMTGISVEPDGIDNYYGFTLDGNQRFLLGDCTVTHNSALSANITTNVGHQGKASAIFNLEMSSQEQMFRLMSCTSFTPLQHIRTGYMHEQDWPKLSNVIPKIKNLPIRIDANANITWPEIRSQCRRWARKGELDLVVIDYLQLLAGEGDRDQRADEKISAITRGCKLMAKELGVPVMLLSQLNRSLESRPNKRPMMSDLRASGAIEQDADLVLFTYRDELYDEDSDDKGVCEIIIGKQRNGPIGRVKLAFLAQFTRHENLAPKEQVR